MTEPLDKPAAPDAEDPEHEAAVAEAQTREVDELGDPNAEDGGPAEEPADADPEPQLNDDADDDLSNLPEGEDNDDDLDGDDEAQDAP